MLFTNTSDEGRIPIVLKRRYLQAGGKRDNISGELLKGQETEGQDCMKAIEQFGDYALSGAITGRKP